MKKTQKDVSIGAQMAIALQLMKRKTQQAILSTGHKISMEQLGILEELTINGEMNMTQLSRAIWKQNANITRMVDKLEAKKLIQRKFIAEDRRSILLSVTDNGKQVFKEILAVVIKSNNDTYSHISKEEQKITLQITSKLIKGLS